jgi:hypothetical protein
MLDTNRTAIAVQYENEHVPYGRRLVTVPLTDEQQSLLRPRHTGMNSGVARYEEIGEAWLEGGDDD